MSDFAPENRFYATQRRVEVDQINMDLAKIEEWRFCRSCHHMQSLAIEPDVHPTCPRCGDAMWSDGGQKRIPLRFKQAIANSNDPNVRIDDSAEDREPKFYVRQFMADFQPSAVREAWQIPAGMTPFGFEFLSRVTFRDVNFGALPVPGPLPAGRRCPCRSARRGGWSAAAAGSSGSSSRLVALSVTAIPDTGCDGML